MYRTLLALGIVTIALLIVSAIQPPVGLRLLARPSPGSIQSVESRGSEIDTIAIDRWGRRMQSSSVYLEWSGYLFAPAAAEYSFREYASGKGGVSIDGRPLLQTAEDVHQVEGTVHLTRGSHKIEIQYDQSARPAALELRAKADEASRYEPLPAMALSPAKLTASAWRVRKVVVPLASAVCFCWTFVFIVAGWRLVRSYIGPDETLPGPIRMGVVFAAVLLVTGIWWGWPGQGWAPDELTPGVVRDALDLKFAGGWHDKYPPFHYYLLAAAYAPFLFADARGLIAAWSPEGQDALMLIGRLLSVAMALGCVSLVWRLASRLFSPRVGLFSAICCATFLPFAYYGKLANLDVPYVFWFVVSLSFWDEVRRSGSMTAYAGLAVSGAIAIATKDQAYGLYVLPAIALAWSAVRRGQLRNLAIATVLAAIALALCFNLPFNASGFIEHVHVLAGPASSDYRMFPSTMSGAAHLLIATLGQLFFCLGVAGTAAVVIGMTAWFRDRRRAPWWLLLPVVSYLLCFVIVVGYTYDRFLLPVLVVLSIAAGTGLGEWFESDKRRLYRTAIGAVIIAALAWRAASLDALLVSDSRYAAERWLRAHLTSADSVASFGDMAYLPRLDRFQHVTLDGTRENTAAVRPRFIVVNSEWMQRYPRSSPRGEWLAWLESGSSPYREAFRYKTPLGLSALRFDGIFTDRTESAFTNLDKANPETLIFERTPASGALSYSPMAEIPRAQDQLFSPGQSAREKYAALVVGRPGWGALLHYELVQLLGQHVPGALGLAMRKAFFPSLLGSCGRNVIFGQNVVIRHPHKVRVGDNVFIDDNCLIDAKGDRNNGITIGDGAFIGRNSILSCKNGDIEIAEGANIGFNCEVFSASRVTIGRDALLAAYVYVIGGDHDFSDPSAPVLAQSRKSQGVAIGAGAWLGAGAKILDGVTIGDRAIVGAAAVVRDAIPAGATAVGIPARVIGTALG